MADVQDDQVVRCPFNKGHLILKHRMPYHIVKCKKHYTGEKLTICHFNATHWVPPEKMKEHLEECDDFRQARRDHDRKVFDLATKELLEKRSRGSQSGWQTESSLQR